MLKRILIIILILFPLIGFTQVVPPMVPPPPPPGLPIDGLTGLFFLVATIYGSKKILKDSSS
ncbi:MAG: hypothetical protein AB8B78_13670 [Polaribacter sp.]